jgi:hypothetical protein
MCATVTCYYECQCIQERFPYTISNSGCAGHQQWIRVSNQQQESTGLMADSVEKNVHTKPKAPTCFVVSIWFEVSYDLFHVIALKLIRSFHIGGLYWLTYELIILTALLHLTPFHHKTKIWSEQMCIITTQFTREIWLLTHHCTLKNKIGWVHMTTESESTWLWRRGFNMLFVCKPAIRLSTRKWPLFFRAWFCRKWVSYWQTGAHHWWSKGGMASDRKVAECSVIIIHINPSVQSLIEQGKVLLENWNDVNYRGK